MPFYLKAYIVREEQEKTGVNIQEAKRRVMREQMKERLFSLEFDEECRNFEDLKDTVLMMAELLGLDK